MRSPAISLVFTILGKIFAHVAVCGLLFVFMFVVVVVVVVVFVCLFVFFVLFFFFGGGVFFLFIQPLR